MIEDIYVDYGSTFKEALTFSDVMFEPQYSEVASRSDVSTETKFSNFSLDVPVISANMSDITGPEMAFAMYKNGALGILHRFSGDGLDDFFAATNLIHEYNIDVKNTLTIDPTLKVGVSIGVQEDDRKRFHALFDAGAKIFCIDIAHGHCKKMYDTLTYLNSLPQRGEFSVIAGNVATYHGALDLAKWGANSIKCGVGPGSVCQTRKNTGAGIPQLYAIMEARRAINSRKENIPKNKGVCFSFKNREVYKQR